MLRVRDEIGRWEPAITVGPVSTTRKNNSFVERLAVEKFVVEWNRATAAERQVLRALSEGASIHAATGRSGGTLALRLVGKGLVLGQNRGEYVLYHPLFAEYIRSVGD